MQRNLSYLLGWHHEITHVGLAHHQEDVSRNKKAILFIFKLSALNKIRFCPIAYVFSALKQYVL